jgi:hypothetical protein
MPDWFYFNTVVLPLLGMGMDAFFLYGVYRTANRWIERKHERELAAGGGGASPAEVEQLRARVDALEDVGYRVQELEERVDFAERMLTQQREQNRLESGG